MALSLENRAHLFRLFPQRTMFGWPISDEKLQDLMEAAREDERSKLSGGGVDLRNAEAVCNFMAAIKIAHAGPQSDLEALRSHVADVERLFDNASKVAHTGFGAMTAERCARNSDAIRTAIVEIERYRALSSEPRSTQLSGGWEPIETAPKDGTYVLVCVEHGDYPLVACGELEGLRCAREGTSFWPEPTHWQPLPPPPALPQDHAPVRGEDHG